MRTEPYLGVLAIFILSHVSISYGKDKQARQLMSHDRPDPRRGDSSGGMEPIDGDLSSGRSYATGAGPVNKPPSADRSGTSGDPTGDSNKDPNAAIPGEDTCQCPSVSGPASNETMTANLKDLEYRLGSLESNIKLQVAEVAKNQYSEFASVLNGTFYLKDDITDTQMKVVRIEAARELLERRLLKLEKDSENLNSLDNDFDNVWAKLNLLTRKTEDLAGMARKTERNTNATEYLKQELSTLRDISSQLDGVKMEIENLGRPEKRPPVSTWNRFTPGQMPMMRPKDCDDIAGSNNIMSGVYEIWPALSQQRVKVYCEIVEGKGWIVLQRRQDGSIDFRRSWRDYEWGFGSLYGEFWLGNSLTSALTMGESYQLKIEITDWDNVVTSHLYNKFVVEGKETNYKLNIGDYQKLGRPDLKDPMEYHNARMFSTFDRDNDDASDLNCASKYNSGWWLGACLKANLNGRYYRQDPYQYSFIQYSDRYKDGIAWLDGGELGSPPSIKLTSMAISRIQQSYISARAAVETGDLPMNK